MKKDWQILLSLANKQLKKSQAVLVVRPNAEGYEIEVISENGTTAERYASAIPEADLKATIKQAWTYATNINASVPPRLIRLVESIQDITLQAWPVIYPVHNDSRTILQEFRRWGEEFEQWWSSQPQDWLDSHDYMTEVESFTDRKCEEYIKTISNQ